MDFENLLKEKWLKTSTYLHRKQMTIFIEMLSKIWREVPPRKDSGLRGIFPDGSDLVRDEDFARVGDLLEEPLPFKTDFAIVRESHEA
jgi:hypothetical protein